MYLTIEPTNQKGFTLINPQVYTEKYSKCFKPNNPQTKHPGQLVSTCDGTNGWYANDPRLYDVNRGFHMQLDLPPIDGSVPLCDVDSPQWDNYAPQGVSYKDIRAGQIMYYLDKSIQDPYFKPIFNNLSSVHKKIIYDPMDAKYTEFERYPLNPQNKVNCSNQVENTCCLSSITDQSEFREDLISLQMRTINRQKYFP